MRCVLVYPFICVPKYGVYSMVDMTVLSWKRNNSFMIKSYGISII